MGILRSRTRAFTYRAATPRHLIGSGAGSDSFVLQATKALPERRGLAPTVRSMLDGPRHYLTYGEYAKFRGKIILGSER